jgi:lipopolysaccharide/colanic/teichoic acid biosynthesis glycosyltransferase
MTLGETTADPRAVGLEPLEQTVPVRRTRPRAMVGISVARQAPPIIAPAEAVPAITMPVGRVTKRTVDLALGVPLLVLATPLLLALALAVRCSSRGPALFCQERPGRDGRPFTIRKFRTMHQGAEDELRTDPELAAAFAANGFKLADDPRVTRVGRFLRRTSLDELPQLLNVVGGSMSLVGPRPVLTEQAVDLYGDRIDRYFAVKPGLTGLWQVSGRSSLTHDERAELDISYVEGWDVGTDVILLARTIPAVVSGRGAH